MPKRELSEQEQELIERIRALAEDAHNLEDHDTEHSLLIIAKAAERGRAEEVYMCLSFFGPMMKKIYKRIKPLIEAGETIVAQLLIGGINLDFNVDGKRPGPHHGPPADPSMN